MLSPILLVMFIQELAPTIVKNDPSRVFGYSTIEETCLLLFADDVR